jgi:hypothetical protein
VGFDCDIDPNASCGGITQQGTCRGSVLTYCKPEGGLAKVDCSLTGATCTFVDDETGSSCQTPPANDCGAIDYLGQCDGGTLVYCGATGLERLDCAGRGFTCGWQDDTAGNMCLDGCQGLDYAGTCDGDTLRYCNAGQVETLDCAADGQTCGFQDPVVGYNCLTPAGAGDCGAIDYAGVCQGDVLQYCDGGTLASIDCAASSRACAYVDDTVGNNCVDTGAAGSCGGVTAQGTCAGNVLSYCSGGAVVQTDCAPLNMTCGWQDANTGYNCLPIPVSGCAADQFTCSDQTCIPLSGRCNGVAECAGGEDEASCAAPTCAADQFTCGDGSCIPATYVCDHRTDCPGGEDEANCTTPACAADQFTCSDGTCIPATYVCDGVKDCAGGEDETGCAVTATLRR